MSKNKWIKWFAWFPIIISGKLIWMKTVLRKQVPRYDPLPLGAYYTYYKEIK
jgi:hypothetical protein